MNIEKTACVALGIGIGCRNAFKPGNGVLSDAAEGVTSE